VAAADIPPSRGRIHRAISEPPTRIDLDAGEAVSAASRSVSTGKNSLRSSLAGKRRQPLPVKAPAPHPHGALIPR